MLALASSIPTLLLAVVLIVSGIAKLRDAAAVRESFITLQMPPWLTRSPAPTLLPWAEIVLALALVVLGGPLLVAAAVAACALFVAYLVIIARAARFDHPVECGCLGRLGLGVVGPVTVVRNAVLVAVSGWVLIDAVAGRSVLARWLDADAASWAWLGMVGLGVLVAGLMVYAGQDPEPDTGATAVPAHVPAGATDPAAADGEVLTDEADYERTPIPHVSLGLPAGDQRVTLRHLAATQARLLVFINPGCGACVPALESLPALRERVGDMIGIHVVFAAETDAENPYVTPAALGDEWFVDEEGIFIITLQLASPGAVLLGADGYLAGGPVVGAQSVIEFFDDIAAALTEDAVQAG
ncbi:MauE/DoxX family redox-associated membrane protein [Granulicoccus sp. GXG6511]|uniref:MauE/DoxX family redox-associated membrane protein n=1 Tax=Granulicoccus sp. GXG6511 TaxID=3381351 RepID=UPI003D7E1971